MLVLTFGMQTKGLVGYIDVDGTTQEHQCTITSFTFLINRGAILWGSKKQSSLHSLQPNPSMSLLHTLPKKHSGFVDSLAKCFSLSHIQQHSTVTISPLLH